MKILRHIQILALLLSGAWFVCAQEEKKEKPPKREHQFEKREGEKREGGPRSHSSFFGNLSEEDQDKLRVAMREAWSDPAVVQARAEVNDASKAYKEAIRAALLRKDPALESLIARMEAHSREHINRSIGDAMNRGGKPNGFGGFDALTGGSPFLRDLSEENRKKYLSLREKAKASPEVKNVMARLEGLRGKDEELRRQQIALFGQLRKAVHEHIRTADPELAKLLPKGGPPRGMGKGKGPKGKGNGEGGEKRKRPPEE